ncbi:MAG: hypothetical protein JNM61_09315 [Zoogloeaceae bacterium]|nr:hypothetical protein [Zoogloeaceae bacterium]
MVQQQLADAYLEHGALANNVRLVDRLVPQMGQEPATKREARGIIGLSLASLKPRGRPEGRR